MNKFEVLTPLKMWHPFEVEPKSMKVDGIPCLIAPTIMLLDIVLVVLPIRMESYAFVILSRDRCTVNVDGYLLIVVMIYGSDGSETAMLSIAGCEKVSIDTETCSQWKSVVGSLMVLVGSYPLRFEWSSQFVATQGNNCEKISVLGHLALTCSGTSEFFKRLMADLLSVYQRKEHR